TGRRVTSCPAPNKEKPENRQRGAPSRQPIGKVTVAIFAIGGTLLPPRLGTLPMTPGPAASAISRLAVPGHHGAAAGALHPATAPALFGWRKYRRCRPARPIRWLARRAGDIASRPGYGRG